MKKLIALLLAWAMVFSLIGCSKESSQEGYRFVCLRGAVPEEDLATDFYEAYENQEGVKATPNDEYIYVDTMNEALMTLKSGKADYYCCYMPVAQYLAARDSSLGIESDPAYYLNLLFRAEDEELRNQFNTAIAELKGNGTIDRLYEQQVTAVLESGEPAEIAHIPVFNEAETITIGVSGDHPPIDYVNAGGDPVGFNLALIAELGKLLELNINVVTVDGGTRCEALSSKRIDAFFWEIVPTNEEVKVLGDSYIVSDPYLEMECALLYVKEG